MGTTGAISSRLFELQNEYGDGVRFSVVNLDGLSSDAQRRSRELSEVRYDLIGAHFLATGTPPKNSSDLNQGTPPTTHRTYLCRLESIVTIMSRIAHFFDLSAVTSANIGGVS